MRRFVLLLLLPLCACAHAYRCPERGGPAWIELEGEHAILRTNLREDDAREFLRRAESVWAMQEAAFPLAPPLEKLVLVAPRSAQEMDELSHDPRQRLEGMGMFGERVLAISGATPPELQQRYLRAVASARLTRDVPAPPKWLYFGFLAWNEALGLADDGRVLAGRPLQNHWERLRKGHTPSQWMFDWGDTRQDWVDDHQLAMSWLMVEHLVASRPTQLVAYLDGLRAGEQHRVAWARAFPELAADALDRELDALLASGKVRIASIAMPAARAGAVSLRVVSEAELHAFRADLRRLSPSAWSIAEIDAEAEEALRHDAGEPLALALSTRSYGRTDRLDEATRLHPEDWRAWLLRWSWANQLAQGETKWIALPVADVIERRTWRDHPHQDPPELAAALQKAYALAPDRYEAAAAFALAQVQAGRLREAFEPAQRAYALRPHTLLALQLSSVTLAARGSCTEARQRLAIAAETARRRQASRFDDEALEDAGKQVAQLCGP